MCFSAGASFSAAAFLSIIGLLSLRKAPKNYHLFAAVPLLFAMQQASEGVLWRLSLTESSDALRQGMIYTFLFFAFVVWPSWIPTSFYWFETNSKRSLTLAVLSCFGLIVSGFLLVSLYMHGASANAIGCHIVYSVPNLVPGLKTFGLLIYATPTILPFFISSLPGASFVGLLIALSCLLAWLIWYAAFTSVWCFFASIISLFVLIYLPSKQRK